MAEVIWQLSWFLIGFSGVFFVYGAIRFGVPAALKTAQRTWRYFMSKQDTKKARKSVEKRTRPEAIECPTCSEFYTPGGPQDKYHTSGACARC